MFLLCGVWLCYFCAECRCVIPVRKSLISEYSVRGVVGDNC